MNQGPRLPLCGKWKACLQNRCSARLEPSTCQNTEWKTRHVNEHATPLAYRPFAESWSFPNKAKYADAYVAGSPLGFPAPRPCRPLGRRHSRSSIPLGPSATQTHSQRPLRVVVDGMCPSTKWQRTTPRLRESSGRAQPARRKNRFIRPPWRPNAEILPQSAGPDNPESRSGAYRGTRTIAIPPCRRAFFLPQNTQNPASPDTEGGWEKMSSPPRCFNHNPVPGDALRRVRSPPHMSISHTEVV